jgi:5-formyltetrahydrofolate cyclo-ligase
MSDGGTREPAAEVEDPAAAKVKTAKTAMRASMRDAVAAIRPFARARRAERLVATVLRSRALAGCGTGGAAGGATRGAMPGAMPGAMLVLLYRAMPDEVDADGIVRALAARGARVAFPLVGDDGALRLLEVAAPDPLDPAHWTRDRFGIAAPHTDSPAVRRVRARELDAVVVPGRAFDRRGARLGRGKGFYDALLGRLRPDARRATVGVCFREQLVDCVPEDGHDRRVAFVAAEGRLFRRGNTPKA